MVDCTERGWAILYLAGCVMTGGISYLLAQIHADDGLKPIADACAECEASLEGRRRDTKYCGDKCRKLGNGQTKRLT